jgi:hypothetical protein
MNRLYEKIPFSDLVLIIPPGLLAIHTISYQAVFFTRFPSIFVVFMDLAIVFSLLAIVGRRSRFAVPAFNKTTGLILLLGVVTAVAAAFILCPNADDLSYYHRAIYQVHHLWEPLAKHDTSVNVPGIQGLTTPQLVTSYEFLVATLSRFLGFHPLFGYHVLFPFFMAFYLVIIYYLLFKEIGFSLRGRLAGTAGTVVFLLFIDGNAVRSFGNVAFIRLWQGKAILWTLFLPLTSLLLLKYYRNKSPRYGTGLILCSIGAVGLSNSGFYLPPLLIGCGSLAYVCSGLFDCNERRDWKSVIMPLMSFIYPLSLGLVLKIGFISSTLRTDIYDKNWPGNWWQNLFLVIGDFKGFARNVILCMVLLFILKTAKKRRMLAWYFIFLLLACFNPIAGKFWFSMILPASYWRLMYLVPVPLAFGAIFSFLVESSLLKSRLSRCIPETILCVAALFFTVFAFHYSPAFGPRTSVKFPWQYQVQRKVVKMEKDARSFLNHHVILADKQVSSALPLLNPTVSLAVPDYCLWKFSNAGMKKEGRQRQLAQFYIRGDFTDPGRTAAAKSALIYMLRDVADALIVREASIRKILGEIPEINRLWKIQYLGYGYAILVKL